MPYTVRQFDDLVRGEDRDELNLEEQLNKAEKAGYNLIAVVSQFKNTTERAAIRTPASGMMPAASFPPIDGPLFIFHKPV